VNVFIPPLDIHISKLVNIVVIDARIGNMCKFVVFRTTAGIISSIEPLKYNKKETQHMDIGVTLILVDKYFHEWEGHNITLTNT
jgi:hypothetical protein